MAKLQPDSDLAREIADFEQWRDGVEKGSELIVVEPMDGCVILYDPR